MPNRMPKDRDAARMIKSEDDETRERARLKYMSDTRSLINNRQRKVKR